MFKRRSRALALIGALALVSASVAAQRKDSPARGNVEGVTAAQMKDYLTLIASDEMEGRDTPSRGLDLTAKYLASQLSRWGLKPAGDAGSYFQRIALRRSKIDAPRTFAEINGQAFNYGEDFLASVFAGSVSGQLVYVSHGWVIKSKNLDPYQSVEVKDKIVVVNSVALPKGLTFNELSKQGENFEAPRDAAQKRGAKGIIYIPAFAVLANWESNRQNAITQGAVFFEKLRPQGASIPAITISPKALNALFSNEKINALTAFNRAATNEPGESFAFNPEKQVSFTVGVKSESVNTQNVVAVLEEGIPIIFYTDGEHEDYHRPSDTVDKIDFEQMEKITRTVYATAWELGNRAQRPRVDKKLPAELMGN